MTPDNLELYLKIAEKIKSKKLRFVADREGFEPEVQEIIVIIRNAESEFKKRQIILTLENHDWLFSHQFADIIKKIGSPYVGICLDCANSLGVGRFS